MAKMKENNNRTMLTKLKILWYINPARYLLYVSPIILLITVMNVIVFNNYFPDGLIINDVFIIKGIHTIIFSIPMMIWISGVAWEQFYKSYISPTQIGVSHEVNSEKFNDLYFVIDSSDKLLMRQSKHLLRLLESVKTLLIKSKLYKNVYYIDLAYGPMTRWLEEEIVCGNFMMFNKGDARYLFNINREMQLWQLNNEQTDNELIWKIACRLMIITVYRRNRIKNEHKINKQTTRKMKKMRKQLARKQNHKNKYQSYDTKYSQ